VEYPEAKEMWDALRAQDRDIFYSLSNNHVKNLFKDIGNVSTVANAWRTTTDITDNWGRVSNDIGFNQNAWAPFAKPGHYNDADMLVVGVVGWGVARQHYTKLTTDECYTHISMWCLLSSPLLLGCDMTKLDAFTLSLLTNDEVLAVDQDPLVKQAVSVAKAGDTEVYRKELEDGSLAVGLFNRGTSETQVTARWSDLKVNGPRVVRDLWRQQDVGTFNDEFTATVHPHGVVLVRVIPAK
jgi:alpha-galactosidase